jgi:hypothetical protein
MIYIYIYINSLPSARYAKVNYQRLQRVTEREPESSYKAQAEQRTRPPAMAVRS